MSKRFSRKWSTLIPVILFACTADVGESPMSREQNDSTPENATPTGEQPSPDSVSEGWKLTVYYTAVENFHTGPLVEVRGCLTMGCRTQAVIGEYPQDFVDRVKNEGTGRITSGAHASKYLNWSHDTGYWLDTAPRDAYGNALIPFVSSAADPGVLARGSRFQIAECGRGADPAFCRELKQAQWQVTDQFTPGYGGEKHLDLYIGEEDQPNFENQSPKYTTLIDAILSIVGISQ